MKLGRSQSDEYHERHESIWLMFIPPFIWAIHLLACYLTAAIWCAKSSGSAEGFMKVRLAIGVYTALAVSAIFWFGWKGFRRHRHLSRDLSPDDDTPLDRYRFLGLATFLLSVLSVVATLFVAAVALFIRNCD